MAAWPSRARCPDSLDEGVSARGFKVEVFNVLGAGDAFMAGFLRGWLRGEPVETCCEWGNACGAIVVSRHGCAPAMPTWIELEQFLSERERPFRLREDVELEHIHWATTRDGVYDELTVLAMDHRSQFEDLIAETGGDAARIPHFKTLALRAVEAVAGLGDDRFGVLLDGRFGFRRPGPGRRPPYWIGRPIELPKSRPLEFESSADVATELAEWPLNHVVKCLVFYHPDDEIDLRERQERQLLRLFDACRKTRHELLVEVILPKRHGQRLHTVARAIRRLYASASGPTGGSWSRSPTPPPGARSSRRQRERSAVPRRGAAGSVGAGGRTAGLVRGRRAVPDHQGLRRRPDHLLRCRPRVAERSDRRRGGRRGAGRQVHGAGRGLAPGPRRRGEGRVNGYCSSHRRPGDRPLAPQQHVETREGVVPYFAGVWAIFGHGNVAGLGEALHGVRDVLPTYRAHNEQGMAHAAIAFAKQSRRERAMVCTTSIGPGATNMVTAAALAHVNRLPVLFLPGDVYASRRPDPVLQQVEDFGDGTISANDCFKPVSRYFDRIVRPEQILDACRAPWPPCWIRPPAVRRPWPSARTSRPRPSTIRKPSSRSASGASARRSPTRASWTIWSP
jgi:hypothetical protein